MARRPARPVIILGVIALLALGAYAVYSNTREPVVRFAITVNSPNDGDHPVLPATGGWPYSQRIPYDWGLDEPNGFRYELVPRVTGQSTLEALSDGNADIAVTGSTPLVQAIADGADVRILARTERSIHQTRLVTTADHVDDWFDQPIGLIADTVLESALYAELDHAGEADRYQKGELDLATSQIPTSMLNGLLDGSMGAAVLLQPHAAALTAIEPPVDTGGRRFVDITTDGLYEFSSFVVTTQQRWEANREGILRAMEATRESRELIAEDPERRLKQIHDYEAGSTPLRDVEPLFWQQDELVFDTDAAAIRAALTTEAKIMVETSSITEIPDFTESLSLVRVVGES